MPDNLPAVIFDLGNVILPFDPFIPATRVAPLCGREPKEVLQLIYTNGWERRFENGDINEDEFLRGCLAELGGDIDPEEFKTAWTEMFEENTGTSDIVRELASNHQLILLSNTNPWHWSYAKANFEVFSHFKYAVVSYRVKAMKPEPKIYEAALSYVRGDRQVIFTDDMEANIIGAENMGITGVKFESVEQLRARLIELGCQLKG